MKVKTDKKRDGNIDQDINRQLFDFIEASPSSFHAVQTMKTMLEGRGYVRLLESEPWKLQKGGKYYVTRNGSSLLAFRIPSAGRPKGFQLMASHSDSPAFKIKENPEMEAEQKYVRLNVEKYGGMLCAPWFDRPLSVAGRILVRNQDRIETRLVHVDRDLLMIPSLAIHMNRKANEGMEYNPQKDLLPLYGMEGAKGSFWKMIAEEAQVCEKEILGHDLFVYSRTKGSIWGADGEFLSIGRLDDLQCAFASLMGFLEAEEGESIPVHAVFDNEEVGSSTKQGAASTFLKDTLQRICEELGLSMSDYRRMAAGSFMASADNAHGVHPNYPEKACPTNRPYLNGGVVIKAAANQKYTTDGVSAAIFSEICSRCQVPVQKYLNRSDMPGGSTLGNISANQVAVCTADIGLAQLAMHSPCETGGSKDTAYLVRAAKELFSVSLQEIGDGIYQLR